MVETFYKGTNALYILRINISLRLRKFHLKYLFTRVFPNSHTNHIEYITKHINVQFMTLIQRLHYQNVATILLV